MIAMGLLALLLSACGGGDDDVPEGREGLSVIKTRADRGLAEATDAVGAVVRAEPRDVRGAYVQAGSSGSTLLYAYEAQATFRTQQPVDPEEVRTTLVDLGLETSEVLDGLDGGRSITASADDHVVSVDLDAGRTRLTLTSQTSGAELQASTLSTEEKADLREPKPLSLDLD
ncbi:hypothetical protein AERYTH_12105 [Aeromicrobium erythreum]|jgi:hypothetical protein|uniref:Uncharacterized protein n=2 Tax=Aeromicrobium erythreum TaxID=2041 RepID=A0A0U4BBZ0_9ACTN|nr:hypothetical protein AERYTH_12105 [Aeromicrobium erythreum]